MDETEATVSKVLNAVRKIAESTQNVEKRKSNLSPNPLYPKRRRREKRLVTPEEYEFATGATGVANQLLIVREENEEKNLVREYFHSQSTLYHCRGCKKSGRSIYASVQNPGDSGWIIRVPLKVDHAPNCFPIQYEEWLKLPKKHMKPKRLLNPEEFELINSNFIDNYSWLIVREEDGSNFGRAYSYSQLKLYYCRGCKKLGKSVYASYTIGDNGEWIIRVPYAEDHLSCCSPANYEKLKIDAMNFHGNIKRKNLTSTVTSDLQSLEWDDSIFSISTSDTTLDEDSSHNSSSVNNIQNPMVTVTNQIIKLEQSAISEFDEIKNHQILNSNGYQNFANSSISSVLHSKIIPLQLWQFGLSREGQILIVKLKTDVTKVLIYKFVEEDDNGTLYYRCSCKLNGPNAVIALLKEEDNIIAVESGIHDPQCLPKSYMEIMKEQAKLGRENYR